MRRTDRGCFDILPRRTQDGRVDPLAAALDVADRLGLDASGAVVLRETRSLVVHLAPSPVVARIWPAGQREASTVRREVEVTAYLAEAGAAVAAPHDDPGPFESDGHELTMWRYVDHDPDRPIDGAAAGHALRDVHDLLADRDLPDLPHFVRLDEVRRIVPTLDVTDAEAADLAEMLARAEERVEVLDVPLQPVHGDSWLGNVLRTPEGPLWSDFELLCRAPRELDVACNENAARHRGRRPEDDAFRTAYGPVDEALLAEVSTLGLVPLTAWTFQLAALQPRAAELARTRLAWALEGLRTRP
jgi:hypothetical protein